MARLKLAIKWLMISLFVLLLGLVGAGYWAVTHPAKAFALVQKYILPADLTIKWDEMKFDAQRASWRHWEIDWSTTNFVVEKGKPALLLPVDQAKAVFTLRVFEGGPWLSFKEIRVNVRETASIKSSGEPSTGPEQNPFEQLQSYLEYLRVAGRWMTVQTIDVSVPRFMLDESSLKARLYRPVEKQSPAATGYDVVFQAGTNVIGAEGWIDGEKLEGTAPFLTLNLDAKGSGWRAASELSGASLGEGAKFDGEVDLTYGDGKKGIKARPKISLTINPEEALLTLSSDVRDIPGPLVRLNGLRTEVHVPFDEARAWSARPATFKIWGPVELFFIDKNMRPPLENACRCKVPEKLVVTYEGRAWLEQMLGRPAAIATVLDSKLAVEGVDNKLLTVNLNAHLQVKKHEDRWLLEPRLDSAATVNSFQGLRQFLDARNVMIPAPLDILDGKIDLTARGAVDHDDKLIRTSADFKINLGSKTQKVDVETNVRLDLARDFGALDISIVTLIKEVRLELPPIDPVRGIPSLKTDSRLVFKPPAPKKKKSFQMRVFYDVKTASAGAVKLLSKMAEPHVPVTIELNNNAKGNSAGFVRLEPFTIKYLRRKVNVERFQITLQENEEGDLPISGRLRVDQTDYKVFVDLAGTSAMPIVNLNSDPFLQREDIISVLLFDRVSDQLVSTDADSSGSVNAAIADRAIGLFGLWAFATTPIRSFSYNAATKQYTATVQLADGLTAGVGTSWERAAHLEVRKRVSRRWVLTAQWAPTENNDQASQLVLQWEKRF